ncbi:hypothetical protein [Paenibacillus sp. Marseille-Q4541]|uniref:hypothetical protein n=1 Tax=Paenibacillus sp. Marseille-Q4541 TaxID=2831522 RepID=UPI001BAA4ED4|nr:hypothetical protein [Paenibacillus sp. Marseille-Q4541]
MHVPLQYEEWSESEKRVVRALTQIQVPQEELFVRKLVNATVIRGHLYEHTANESEDGYRHLIYAQQFNTEQYSYGKALYEATFDAYRVSSYLACEYVLWNGRAFKETELTLSVSSPLEIAKLLLDHLIVHRDETYEMVYSTFDSDRGIVMIYLKRGDF